MILNQCRYRHVQINKRYKRTYFVPSCFPFKIIIFSVLESTLLGKNGGREGVLEKSTLCTLVIMMKMMDGPLADLPFTR